MQPGSYKVMVVVSFGKRFALSSDVRRWRFSATCQGESGGCAQLRKPRPSSLRPVWLFSYYFLSSSPPLFFYLLLSLSTNSMSNWNPVKELATRFFFLFWALFPLPSPNYPGRGTQQHGKYLVVSQVPADLGSLWRLLSNTPHGIRVTGAVVHYRLKDLFWPLSLWLTKRLFLIVISIVSFSWRLGLCWCPCFVLLFGNGAFPKLQNDQRSSTWRFVPCELVDRDGQSGGRVESYFDSPHLRRARIYR